MKDPNQWVLDCYYGLVLHTKNPRCYNTYIESGKSDVMKSVARLNETKLKKWDGTEIV